MKPIVWRHGKTFLPFFLALGLLTGYALLHRDVPFVYDSLGYWELGKAYWSSGRLDLNQDWGNFAALRGYLFPSILGGIHELAKTLNLDPVSFMLGVSVFSMALLLGFILPATFRTIFGGKPEDGWKSGIVSVLLVFFFWRGAFLYPLSDFYSIAFAGVALICFSKLKENRNPIWAIPLAISLSATHLVRPAYLVFFLCLFVVTILTVFLWRKESWKKKSLALMVFLLFVALVHAPQAWVNQQRWGLQSPLVPVKLYFKESATLYQLRFALGLQKYETVIDPAYTTGPTLTFRDPVAENILAVGQVGPSFKSVGEYAQLIARHPVDFIAVFSKHLFNGLDIKYPSMYVNDVYQGRVGFSLLNYTIWFLAGCFLLMTTWPNWKTMEIWRILFAFLFLLPSLAAIPFHVEVRFYLAFHLLAYGIIAHLASRFSPVDFRRWWGESPPQAKIRLLALYLIFLAVCIMLSSGTFSLKIGGGNPLLWNY